VTKCDRVSINSIEHFHAAFLVLIVENSIAESFSRNAFSF
jgi:hypothetical protein